VMRSSFVHVVALAVAILLVASQAASGRQVSRIPGVASPAAWRALEDRRFAEAAELFEAAARRAPRDATLRFGAGVAHLMQGKNAEARRAFEAALAIDPMLTDAAVLLGQALYRDGQLQDAIKAYESALRHAPNHAELTAALAQWRKEASTEGQFFQAQGAHFTVHFEGPADDAAAQRALEVLEEAYWRIGRELSIYPQRPLSVVLYTREQFRDVTRSPEWASGVYDGRIKVPMAGASESTSELRRVLEHELVHAMVATAAGPTVPAWLNEGLATALEPEGTEWAEEQLRASSVRVPLAQLTRGFRGLSAAQARAAYAQSALAVKSLLDRQGSAGVVRLLQAVGRGVPFAEAFHQSIATTLDEFATQFAAR
jgi:tetratricopeptide (TPR) repeat protein